MVILMLSQTILYSGSVDTAFYDNISATICFTSISPLGFYPVRNPTASWDEDTTALAGSFHQLSTKQTKQ